MSDSIERILDNSLFGILLELETTLLNMARNMSFGLEWVLRSEFIASDISTESKYCWIPWSRDNDLEINERGCSMVESYVWRALIAWRKSPLEVVEIFYYNLLIVEK